MLIDLNEHDLAVIVSGLGVLCKRYPVPSENNKVQETIDRVQQQIDETYELKKKWEELPDNDLINIKLGGMVGAVEREIDNMKVSPDVKKFLKMYVIRLNLNV